MLQFLSSPIEPIQLTDIVDTHGFEGLGLFSDFLFNYFPDILADIIAPQINQTKGSDRKMWLEVWEEKAVIPLCSAGSYQIRFTSSCSRSELQGCRHRLVQQLLRGAAWELCPCLGRGEPADVTHAASEWLHHPRPSPCLFHTTPSPAPAAERAVLIRNSYSSSSSTINDLYF